MIFTPGSFVGSQNDSFMTTMTSGFAVPPDTATSGSIAFIVLAL